MLKLNIRPTAAVDLAETLAWYGGVSSTLADAFLEQLDIGLVLLVERPNIGSRRFSHLFKPNGGLFKPC